MTPADILPSLIELSIAIAGFSAVVVAIVWIQMAVALVLYAITIFGGGGRLATDLRLRVPSRDGRVHLLADPDAPDLSALPVGDRRAAPGTPLA
jgi:hypothetical protein